MLCWDILQALGITACFQHLYLKHSSVACPWVFLLLWLLSVYCKGARLLHQLLLLKCWPWGPQLFFCLAIFTCFPGPQSSLQPQCPTLGCFCLKGLFSCGPDGTSWSLNGGVLEH